MRNGQKGVYFIACGVSSRTHLVRRRNEDTWCGGETSTSISNAMLLKKKKKEVINLKADHCHHRPRSKAHSNEYENNTHKAQPVSYTHLTLPTKA